MLKYQLRKDVALEDGMAFKYSSNEELEALVSALNKKCVLSTEKINYGISKGFLIILDTKKDYLPLATSKFFTRSDQYLVRKKDVFNKTEYDNGPKNKKGQISSIMMANANQISGDDVKCSNEQKFRDQTDVNNNGCPVKAEISVHDCGFRTSTSQTCSTTAETNKPFVAYAITDGCGLMVPLETCKEGMLTDTHRLKGVFMGIPAEQHPFADKLYIVAIETDRINKLVESKFPLFIRTGIYNIGSDTPSVSFKIPGSVFGFKVTLEGEKVINIEFDFNSNDDSFVYTNFLKELIARYFNVEKEKPKEGTKFEAVTDKNGDTRILMTDSLGNKSTLI